MSLVAVQVEDGDFHCTYAHITTALVSGRARLLIIAFSTPGWLSSELIRYAEMVRCPYLYYDQNVIEIATSLGSIIHTRYIVFTNIFAAAEIQLLVP